MAPRTWRRLRRWLQALSSRSNGHDTRRPPPWPSSDTGPAGHPAGTPPDASPCPVSFPLSAPSSPILISRTPNRRVVPFPCVLSAYLRDHGNPSDSICKTHRLLQMPRVMLEIGCGVGEAARRIAVKNPDMGVVATDLFDGLPASCESSYYGKIARDWREGVLPAQQDPPDNLVILRAEADILRCLPLGCIDTILLINPEPTVGRAFLELLRQDDLCRRIKQGPTRIVILPYSREMGVMACGGFDFEHDPDWSRGLGYIKGSGLSFRQGLPVQWGIDLRRVSAYSANSTQSDLYIWGDDAN